MDRIRVPLVSTHHRKRSNKRSSRLTGAVPLLAPAAVTWQIAAAQAGGHPDNCSGGTSATDSYFTWPHFLSDGAELEKRFRNRSSWFINLRLAIKRISQLFVFTRARPGFPQSSPKKRLDVVVTALVLASVQVEKPATTSAVRRRRLHFSQQMTGRHQKNKTSNFH